MLVDTLGFDDSKAGIQFETDSLAERVPASQIIVVTEAASVDKVQPVFARVWARGKASETSETLAIRTA